MTPQVQGVTNSTESPIQFMTIDACGRILQSDGDVMRPTGGMVQIIPAEVIQPEDLKRQREILAECLDRYPEYLIGHEVHKFIPEWKAVARGRIMKYDANEKWWIVKYDADHKTSDFDKEQILKYAINREEGESAPDGGLASMLRYQNKPDGDIDTYTYSDSDSSPDDTSLSDSGGDNPVNNPVNTSSPGSGGDSSNSNSNSNSYYEAKDKDTWTDILNGCGVEQSQQRPFLKWLKNELIYRPSTVNMTTRQPLSTGNGNLQLNGGRDVCVVMPQHRYQAE